MRTIVITGASGGLAQEIVKRLPDDKLILLGRDRKKLEMLYQYHTAKEIYELDITDSKVVESVVADILASNPRIDILINNAGYGQFKPFTETNVLEMQDMYAVNVFATIQFCQLIGQCMVEQKQGHIVNIASMAGKIATAKSSLYASTKFAIIGYSDALRLELAGAGVQVTTVNPGPIATSFFDQADPSGAYLKSVERFTLQPDYVARKIVALLGTNKRELNLPLALSLAHKFYTVFPRLSDWLARTIFNYK